MLLGNLLKKNPKKMAKTFDQSSLRSPEVLGVNLVKDEIIVFFDWKKHILLAILVFILVGLFVFEIYSGLGYWEKQENQRAEELKNKTDILKMDVIKLTSEHAAALDFRDKSGAFSELLKNHVYWTEFFDWLQENTLSTVTYEGFSGDLTGNYEINATAPTYAEASWQAKAFADNEFVKSVKISSVLAGKVKGSVGKEDNNNNAPVVDEAEEEKSIASVSFTIELKIDPELFRVAD